MTHTRTTIPLAATLAAALALGACSSSGGHQASAGAPSDSSNHATAAATKAAPASSKSHGGGSIGGTAWCSELSHAGDAIIALGGSSTQSSRAYLAKGQQLAADAPGAIKPDVEALLAINKKILAGDSSAEDAFANPATLTHIRHFAAWLKANCKGLDIQVPGLPSASN
jgi:hypothetical protein